MPGYKAGYAITSRGECKKEFQQFDQLRWRDQVVVKRLTGELTEEDEALLAADKEQQAASEGKAASCSGTSDQSSGSDHKPQPCPIGRTRAQTRAIQQSPTKLPRSPKKRTLLSVSNSPAKAARKEPTADLTSTQKYMVALRTENDWLWSVRDALAKACNATQLKQLIALNGSPLATSSLTLLCQEWANKQKARRIERGADPEFSSAAFDINLQKNGGWIVDPKSGTTGEILDEDGRQWATTLTMLDLVQNLNSFHIMQVISSPKGKAHTVWSRWGRIGSWQGYDSKKKFSKSSDAKEYFGIQYLSLTGNTWSTSRFVKKPGKFAPLEHGDTVTKNPVAACDHTVECALELPVRHLVELLSSTDSLRRALRDSNIDDVRMPLGSLSESQVKKAYLVLKQIETVLHNQADISTRQADAKSKRRGTSLGGGTSPPAAKIRDLTSKFYTLIPHSFSSTTAPPAIDSDMILSQKAELVSMLSDIKIASSLLQRIQAQNSVHPLDQFYLRLQSLTVGQDHLLSELTIIACYGMDPDLQTTPGTIFTTLSPSA
eukprot:gene8311-1482_t